MPVRPVGPCPLVQLVYAQPPRFSQASPRTRITPMRTYLRTKPGIWKPQDHAIRWLAQVYPVACLRQT